MKLFKYIDAKVPSLKYRVLSFLAMVGIWAGVFSLLPILANLASITLAALSCIALIIAAIVLTALLGVFAGCEDPVVVVDELKGYWVTLKEDYASF